MSLFAAHCIAAEHAQVVLMYRIRASEMGAATHNTRKKKTIRVSRILHVFPIAVCVFFFFFVVCLFFIIRCPQALASVRSPEIKEEFREVKVEAKSESAKPSPTSKPARETQEVSSVCCVVCVRFMAVFLRQGCSAVLCLQYCSVASQIAHAPPCRWRTKP